MMNAIEQDLVQKVLKIVSVEWREGEYGLYYLTMDPRGAGYEYLIHMLYGCRTCTERTALARIKVRLQEWLKERGTKVKRVWNLLLHFGYQAEWRQVVCSFPSVGVRIADGASWLECACRAVIVLDEQEKRSSAPAVTEDGDNRVVL